MKHIRSLTRRELLQAAGASALAAARLTAAAPQTSRPRLPTRPLGRSGRSVCMLALGTGRLAHGRSFASAVETVRYAIDSGISYIDTARSYHSEKHVGQALAGRRSDLFIATKTLQRGYDGAMRELEQSLSLLGTGYLDLWQVHSIGHRGASAAQELARLRAPDGVMKAMRKAKQEGTARLIGFTGHTDPHHMLRVLAADDLEFDTMLFVISAALARRGQRGWEERLLPAGRRHGLGLIAMKVFGAGKAVGQGQKKASPAELLSYVWDRGLPVANVGLHTRRQIDAAVAACRAYAARQRPKKPAPAGGGESPGDLALRARLRNTELPYERPDYHDGSG